MTVHIIGFPQREARPASNEPALVCREARLKQSYHYWRGRSGRRYLHTVFPLIECPEIPKANFILVRRAPDGTRRALAVGQTTEDAMSLNLAHLRHQGARLGANEIHIHLLAETAAERDLVEQDLRACRPDLVPLAAPLDPLRLAG